MPLYEYLCQNCNTRLSILVKKIGEPSTVVCSTCGSNDLIRVFSTFAYHKSKGPHGEAATSQFSQNPDLYKDPRNVDHWIEEKFTELGHDRSQIREEIEAGRRELDERTK